MSSPDDAGGDVSELDASVPIVGSFAVSLVAPTSSTDGFTSVLGRVYDSPMPPQLAWEVADTAAGCELRIPVVPFCDPGCDTTAVCTEQGCVDYPAAQELGTVSVSGLQASAIEMEPVNATYQLPPQIELPHPPADEGAAIALQTTGGAYEPFTISGRVIAPLELAGPEQLPLRGEQPLRLEWVAAKDARLSRVQVKVDISHHGGLKGVIECDLADEGEAVIDASLIEQLIGLGTAGFPTVSVARVGSAGVEIAPGGVLLSVSSRVERALELEGVTSCNDDDECSVGQVCAPDRTCQDA